MGKVVVINHVTLDGVMQGPGRPDEDTRGSSCTGLGVPTRRRRHCRQGRGADGRRRRVSIRPAHLRAIAGLLERPGRPIQGRSQQHSEVRRFAQPRDELEWRNSTLLDSDVPAAVAELKQASRGDLVIMGSGELIAALMAADLIDEVPADDPPPGAWHRPPRVS
jgi:hypothetical protein